MGNFCNKKIIEVNVVALMSAGKSTLINSLLGKELLTTNSQACTAKVMEIIDNDDDTFSAIAKDDLGNPIKSFSNVTAENIKEINSNSSIKKVEIKGNIPFVDTKESYLALLDSPGTNYTEDPTHKTATLEMIRNSTKVLVIFVIDAGNASTNDQKELFKAISESMNGTKDKQLKERFLFVINKTDKIIDDIEKNPELHVQDVINKIVEPLKDFGIENPNIFPVSAEMAFKIRNFDRISERERGKLIPDINFINDTEEFHLEKYSKLPNVNKEIIDKELKEAIENNDIEKQALIHSGIRNLEEAIKNYCSKNNNVIKNNYLGGKMKEIKVEIKHNPYTLETEFKKDGKKFPEDSKIYPILYSNNDNEDNKKRFQEWVSDIPQLLIGDCNGKDLNIIFHGTKLDYQDLKFELEKKRDKMKNQKDKFIYKLEHKPAEESFEKIKELDGIYETLEELSKNNKIQDFNIKSLKQQYEKSKNMKTEVNVVAIMSAGKSTLINSLLGKELLTTNSQACTAKVMEIIDNDDDTFSAIAKDDLGNPIKSFSNVTAENIKEINSNSSIKKVEIKGNIPFVDTKESYLALLDSPGTNYTEDPTHKTATLEMIRNSTKVLVIFVIDAGNASTNDQKELFKAISESMNGTKDKQLKERFLFVINKTDKIIDDIEKNPELHVQDVINKIVEPLKDFGIENPNIFPVSAEMAFKIRNFDRISERERGKLIPDINFINDTEEFHLEKYSKLPNVNKEIIDKELKEAIENNDIQKQALIHSGIRNLEEAISVFVTKYSRPAKVNSLQKAIKKTIEDAKSITKTIESIPTDNKKLEEYNKKIEILRDKLSSKIENQKFKEKIENLDITTELKESLDIVKGNVEKIISVFKEKELPEQIVKDEVIEKVLSFQNKLLSYQKTFENEIKELLKKNIEGTSEKLLQEYIARLNKISREVNISEINLSSYIQSEINLLKFSASQEEILEKTEKKTEYYYDYELRHRAWYNPMRYIDDEYYEERVTKSREVEIITKKKFDEDILMPVRKELNEVINKIKEFGEKQANNIKKEFNRKFDEVDNVLEQIADKLIDMTKNSKILEQKIVEAKHLENEIKKIQEKLDKILEI